MFCKKCGTKIEDGISFCPKCGNRVEQVNPENSVTSAQTAEPDQNVGTPESISPDFKTADSDVMNQTAQSAETAYSNAEEQNTSAMNLNLDYNNQPKKRKFPKKLVIIGTAVLLVVALIAVNFWAIVGALIKNFGSGSDYLRYVESKALSSFAGNVTEIYGKNFKNALSSNVGAKAEFNVNLTDKGNDIVNDIAGANSNVDLGWLKDAKLSVDVSRKDKNEQVKASLKLGGKDIVSVDCILDFDNNDLYLGIPEISEKYLSTSVKNSNEFNIDDLDSIAEALPDKNKLNKMLEKYVKIALESINDVEKSDKSLKIGNIKQDCTVLTFDVDERLLLEIGQNILKEAENDRELKDMINDIADAVKEISGVSNFDVEDLMNDLDEEIEDRLDDLKGDGEKYITLIDYVNGWHEIIGRKLIVNDKEVASYGTAKNGSDLCYELKFGDDFVFSGDAKGSGSQVTGEYELKIDGKETLIIETDKFDVNKLKKGELQGTLRLKPGSAMIEDAGSSAPVSLSDIALEMNFSGKEFDTKLLLQDEELVKINTKTEMKGSDNINVPDDGKTLYADNQDDIKEYVKSANFDAVIDSLRDAGVTDEIVDSIQEFTDYLVKTANYSY